MVGRNEVTAREGIDTPKKIFTSTESNFDVEMRYQPVRALTQFPLPFLIGLFLLSRNEVTAREGIDTKRIQPFLSAYSTVEMR